MLFNSTIFIFFFLPFSFAIYFILGKFSKLLSLVSLIFVSSFFYAWQEPSCLLLIFASIFINFLIAGFLCRPNLTKRLRFYAFVTGIFLNLGGLLYFKYFNFILSNISYLLGLKFQGAQNFLPLAISFFTFQQISFLISFYKRSTERCDFFTYSSSILFFPHLLAGPILNPIDLMPQFEGKSTYKINSQNIAIGLTIFVIGLFKKVIIADSAATYVDAVFNAVDANKIPLFFEAWFGIFLFSFQIYFDFSGYSDMAIGLARLFNIKFPINFNSPYKSASIIAFWRNWHITLSTFLRDNVYIPLGGTYFNKYRNLFFTMLIGGLWHGASWNFVIWGGLHGIYLIINHLIRDFKTRPALSYAMSSSKTSPNSFQQQMSFSKLSEIQNQISTRQSNSSFVNLESSFLLFIKRTCIFLLVSLTWLFFRSTKFSTSISMLKGLFGLNGVKFPKIFGGLNRFIVNEVDTVSIGFKAPFILSIVFFSICMFLPSVYSWLIHYRPASGINNKELSESNRLCLGIKHWKPTVFFAFIIVILFCISFNGVDNVRQFIYYKF